MSISKTFIIAEAGVNHNGSFELALELIEAAKQTGADAIKFQTFDPKKLVVGNADKAEYQKNTTGSGSQREMLEKLKLSDDDFLKLSERARELGIEFMSSAFDVESLEVVVALNIAKLKLGSGELTSAQMLSACAKTKLPLILSTGMANLDEIREALSLVAQVYVHPEKSPNSSTWHQAYESELGQKLLKERVTLLHCTSGYPCPFDQVDLLAMEGLRKEFGLEVGYSDHTEGISVSVAAVALGARVIEKHFTTDRNLVGPDHKASLDPVSFKEMVKQIREVERALGSKEKFVRPVEENIKLAARKSLVAAASIKKGERFTPDNLTAKRPGGGISAMKFWDVLGGIASQNYEEDDLIVD